MGRYMTELGMTPASRSRVDAGRMELPQTHTFVTVYEEKPTASETLLAKLKEMAQRTEPEPEA